MADNVVIRAEKVGKKFVIGHQAEERYTALRDVLARTAKTFARNTLDIARGRPLVTGEEQEEFWALRDVSFEINRGDVVGIIGRNGAGKSTLLKILSRITEPTQGRISIQGRVASLLEVGTGFHPELTGRENIFLNGAILGMTRAEIRSKFDEIVEFSEVQKFLDTPVKRYSSGMYVRLAFAVAAHLEPEILIIDEVLAVGDAEFQRKCLGKMRDVAGRGRTVLFVSHNLRAIRDLCNSGILLEGGRVTNASNVEECLRIYSTVSSKRSDPFNLTVLPRRAGEGKLRFSEYQLSSSYLPVNAGTTGAALEVSLTISGEIRYLSGARVTLSIHDMYENVLLIADSQVSSGESIDLAPGDKVLCCIPRLPLTAGEYLISFFLASGGIVHDWIDSQCQLTVHHGRFFQSSSNSPPGWEGRMVLFDYTWSHTKAKV